MAHRSPDQLKNPSLSILLAAFTFAILTVSSPSLQADGFVLDCTEASLDQALTNSGTVYIRCNSTINITSAKIIPFDIEFDLSTNKVTIRGQGTHRLFEIRPGARLVLRRTTLTNGMAPTSDGRDGTSGSPDAGRGDSAMGGAILNEGGELVLVDCMLENNRAEGGRGGNGFTGSNCNDPGSGGASGQGLGGAIYHESGTLAITNCTFRNNVVAGGTGGDGGDASNCSLKNGATGRSGGNARGAGIYVERGDVHIVNSTFSGQSAQGGDGGDGGEGSGSFGRGGDGGRGGHASGGAVYNNAGFVDLLNCTVAGNTVAGGSGGSGGPAQGGDSFEGDRGNRGGGVGNGVHGLTGTMAMVNSVLSSSGEASNCAGEFSDGGNNISTDESCSLFPLSHNNLDPLLGSLRDNGGPTLTILPSPDSPLIDRANQLLAPAMDQRSYARDINPDIGATELHAITLKKISEGDSIREGDAEEALFEISQSMSRPFPIQIQLTWQGSATRDVDYAATGTTNTPLFATIAAGDISAVVSISPLEDDLPENSESINLRLSSGLYDIDPVDNAASVSLLDNDPIHLEVIRHTGDEGFLFRFNSLTGLVYRMDFTTNFRNWQTSTSIMAGSGGVLQWLDAEATNRVRRYYRVWTP